jgi:hypothetical protein
MAKNLPSKFSVATLNVHGWADAREDDNVERVANLIKVNDTFYLLARNLTLLFFRSTIPTSSVCRRRAG